MKIIIAGSRNILDLDFVYTCLDLWIPLSNLEVVSGHASGVDSLGEMWADSNGINFKVFKADWEQYGKAAGSIRNKQMADYADALICIWDGKSKGSKHMIDCMHTLKKPYTVIFYNKEKKDNSFNG